MHIILLSDNMESSRPTNCDLGYLLLYADSLNSSLLNRYKCALLYSLIGSIVRLAELHSPSAERNCMTENISSLRSEQGTASLAPRKRLPPVDLPPASLKGKVLPKANLRFSKLYLLSVYSFGKGRYTEYNQITKEVIT